MLLTPSVAVVILNYNGRNFLEQFLPSVISSTYSNCSIIVADNASTDNSVEFVQQHFPSIQILLNLNNDGFAGGYNWALKRVEADYYVLLNSDVEVTPKWIEPVIDLMELNKDIAACQPKILSWHNKTQFEYAGASGGFIDALGYPFTRGRVFDVCENDEQQYNTAEPIFWATGAAMFVRSKVFHQLNGFDGSFFAHMEEIDLCWRMQLAGYSIYVQPASVVYHVGGGTLPKGYRKTYLNFRNNLIMLSKNLPVKEKIYKIPIRFILDGITACKDLFSGNSITFKAVFNAHIATVKWWFFGEKNKQTKKTL
ncbi:MAG: glycosyltransferase family 2 protein, partial [Chitinophagaceae bacterium]|nr:glycosyltransferase family 2 protein [Chitinophagaceae bacterium]